MKHRKFLLFLTILSGISFLRVQAQDSGEKGPVEKLKHSIGFAGGFTTGYGLSYRYWPGKFGAQITCAPYKSKETSRYSIGIAFMYQLIETKITKLYVYQGNHYYYHSELQYVYDPNPPYTERRERVSEGYVNNGIGFGIEVLIAKRIGLNFMAGYAAYNNFRQLNLTGEAALYYKF